MDELNLPLNNRHLSCLGPMVRIHCSNKYYSTIWSTVSWIQRYEKVDTDSLTMESASAALGIMVAPGPHPLGYTEGWLHILFL